jgi:hypothetical protein
MSQFWFSAFESCAHKSHPTMRAADDGWAARFLSFFAALSLFRFDSAANACRWAACDGLSQKLAS